LPETQHLRGADTEAVAKDRVHVVEGTAAPVRLIPAWTVALADDEVRVPLARARVRTHSGSPRSVSPGGAPKARSPPRSGLDRSIVADQSVELLSHATLREADLTERGQDDSRGDTVLGRVPPVAHQRAQFRIARRPGEGDAHHGPDVEAQHGQESRRSRARDL